MICSRYDVVTVPFPFVDGSKTKKRPALVLSNKEFNRNNHTILAMITTKREPAWPGDSQISDYADAGLRLSCLVRFKFFTLDNRLLQKKLAISVKRIQIKLQSIFVHIWLSVGK